MTAASELARNHHGGAGDGLGHDPLVVAAALLAEAGTRRDDAGVLVLKP